jgi:drug/metabolite transporter (DMT)-like permease
MALPPIEDRRLAGIGLIVAAYALFAGIDSCAKWLTLAGMPIWQVACVRFLGHGALTLALLMPSEGLAMLRPRAPRVVALRALCLLSGTLFNFVAVQHLPLALTATIFFASPLAICALSAPLLGEKVGPRRWAAIAVGFCGVLIATRPWGAQAHWAILCSLGAMLSASLYAILTRRLAGVDSSGTQQIYASLAPGLVLLPVALADFSPPSALPGWGASEWAALALIGCFGFAGHQLLTRAHRLAEASVLAPFVYVHLGFMTFAGWAVFGEVPEIRVLVGGMVTLASGLYLWARERRLARAS